MIEKMVKARIIGLNKDIFSFIEVVSNLKTLHVTEPKKEEQKPFSEYATFSITKGELENLDTLLSVVISQFTSGTQIDVETDNEEYHRQESIDEIINETKKLLSTVRPEVQRIETDRLEIEHDLEQLKQYNMIIKQIADFLEKLVIGEHIETLVALLHRHSDADLKKFEEQIRKCTHGIYEVFYKTVSEEYKLIVLLFGQEYLTEVHSLLFKQRISELHLPSEIQNISPQELPKRLASLIEEKTAAETVLREEKTALGQEYYKSLDETRREVRRRLRGFQLCDKMTGTADTFELLGYLPENKWEQFETILTNKFEDRILIIKSEGDSNSPILRKNPRLVKPFETLVNMLQPPKYGTSDPTLFLAILFPLFWGFMVGDVGYAIVVFLISAYARKKFIERNASQQMIDLTEIFMISSVWAAFFGLIFGEFFGTLAEWIYPLMPFKYPFINRFQDIMELLFVSIAIGFCVIFFGLLLGAYNHWQIGHKKHAYGNLILGIIWGSVVPLIILILILPEWSSILIYVFAILWVGLIFLLMWYGGGPKMALEIISKLSNILSFSRLMAIGLVGVWMAYIANYVGFLWGFPAGVIFAIVMHSINIAILTLSPTIHSMRLNFFEVFQQFVVDGGESYKPYG